MWLIYLCNVLGTSVCGHFCTRSPSLAVPASVKVSEFRNFFVFSFIFILVELQKHHRIDWVDNLDHKSQNGIANRHANPEQPRKTATQTATTDRQAHCSASFDRDSNVAHAQHAPQPPTSPTATRRQQSRRSRSPIHRRASQTARVRSHCSHYHCR